MTKKDLTIARDLKKRLSGIAQIVDFRVFGSRARGEADEYSDMDVFVEVEQLDKQVKDEIKNISWEVGFNNLIHISPLIFSRYEIEKTPLRASFLVKNITREGIKV